jgi:hypothetical protein
LAFDRERIRKIVHEIGERLEGDWLLIGGALVALWLESERTTEDLDVVWIRGAEEDPRLALFGLAERLGLPVEALNTAADFFVQRVPGWRQEIEVLHRGSAGTIYRPTATLFLLLKVGRLSEQDLSDCLDLLRKVEAEGAALDTARVLAALDGLADTDDEQLRARRARLRSRLSP